MDDNQLLRYSRHILLKEFGVEAQDKLLASSALVVGAGGLGSAALMYLASAGIGKIAIADGDKVRAAIAFRGREMSHRELGSKILARLRDDLAEVADVEVSPKMEGYQMFAIFVPKKGKK